MSFVPFVPPVTTPRARELARAIDKTIEEFRRRETRTSDQDVRRALQLASARQGGAEKTLLILMAALGVIGFLLALGIFVSRG